VKDIEVVELLNCGRHDLGGGMSSAFLSESKMVGQMRTDQSSAPLFVPEAELSSLAPGRITCSIP
jgi:hypothetical protein